jgi:hypothetical protein
MLKIGKRIKVKGKRPAGDEAWKHSKGLPPTGIDAHCHQQLIGLQFDKTPSSRKNGIWCC